MGWIYCEGTNINYPVVQAEDNDYYLHRSYDGTYSISGSIFVEESNTRGFEDANTIIYGHHMNDGTMFNTLDEWASQEFYDSHPIMWLLTPQQDYKVIIVSSYNTDYTSDTYTIIRNPGSQLDGYLKRVFAQSQFQTDVKPDNQGKYIVMSTCAYVYNNARRVLHGQLIPVDSIGGVPITTPDSGVFQ